MATQLHLIHDPEPSWRIDERTCEVGRRGIAAARAALRQANRPRWDTVSDGGSRAA